MLTVKLAQTTDDIRAAQRLRYDVFATEMGATGPSVNHEKRMESDHYDNVMDHLLLTDTGSGDIVGTLRLLPSGRAPGAGGFYSASEFDLAVFAGMNVLELGRMCVAPKYRTGVGVAMLWNALSQYVRDGGYQYLFGVASFPGTDVAALADPLAYVFAQHMAPEPIRPYALRPMVPGLPPQPQNRRAAVLQIPGLIKAYLRAGAMVGQGYHVDHDFNTTDICVVFDATKPRETYAQRGKT